MTCWVHVQNVTISYQAAFNPNVVNPADAQVVNRAGLNERIDGWHVTFAGVNGGVMRGAYATTNLTNIATTYRLALTRLAIERPCAFGARRVLRKR